LVDKPASSSLASVLSDIPLGTKPADHKSPTYVFSHKSAVKSVEPAGTSCAACHTRSYCENCHNSGAVKVKHDSMLYNHAASAAAAGGTQSCAYCHQSVACAKCHKGPVLDGTGPTAAIKARQTP
jgi:hypothetical protein